MMFNKQTTIFSLELNWKRQRTVTKIHRLTALMLRESHSSRKTCVMKLILQTIAGQFIDASECAQLLKFGSDKAHLKSTRHLTILDVMSMIEFHPKPITSHLFGETDEMYQ